jgi:hypothetical protein
VPKQPKQESPVLIEDEALIWRKFKGDVMRAPFLGELLAALLGTGA